MAARAPRGLNDLGFLSVGGVHRWHVAVTGPIWALFVTNLGRRSNVFLFCADYIDDGLKSALTCSTWAKRSRFSQVLAVSTVGTSRSRAPCGRVRNRLGLSGKCFLKQLPNSPGSRRMPGWSVPGAEPESPVQERAVT